MALHQQGDVWMI